MARQSVPPASENEILRFLQDRYSTANALVERGIGDDAAVVRPAGADEFWLLTTDMLAEGIDFRLEWATARQLGRKSIAVNLSDLAAMGARPRFHTVSLGLPRGVSRRWISQFYRGLTERGHASGTVLVGGDLSDSPGGILISITAVGESAGRKVLYRSGGRAGDFLYVTGILGRSAAGLGLLRQGCIRPRDRSRREAIRLHREPEPRCETGLWLAQSGFIRCMMDLSDGLSVDLPRLCAASGTGAEVDSGRLPVFSEAAAWGFDPVALALHGGEDFELLFSVPESKHRLFEARYPGHFPRATRIGRMVRGSGDVWIHHAGKDRRRLKKLGYDHFRME
jgi:thiamine-monophosphate kinase